MVFRGDAVPANGLVHLGRAGSAALPRTPRQLHETLHRRLPASLEPALTLHSRHAECGETTMLKRFSIDKHGPTGPKTGSSLPDQFDTDWGALSRELADGGPRAKLHATTRTRMFGISQTRHPDGCLSIRLEAETRKSKPVSWDQLSRKRLAAALTPLSVRQSWECRTQFSIGRSAGSVSSALGALRLEESGPCLPLPSCRCWPRVGGSHREGRCSS